MVFEHIVDVVTLLLLLSVVVDTKRDKEKIEKRLKELERDSDGRYNYVSWR